MSDEFINAYGFFGVWVEQKKPVVSLGFAVSPCSGFRQIERERFAGVGCAGKVGPTKRRGRFPRSRTGPPALTKELKLHSTKWLKTMVAAIAVASLFAAVSASPAFAEIRTAKFSASTIKLTTSGITVKRSNGESKACTLKGGATSGTTTGAEYIVSNENFLRTRFECAGGTKLEMLFSGEASFDTVSSKYSLVVAANEAFNPSPWGQYFEEETVGTWVNGSGSTNSTVTFQEASIGQLSSSLETLKISGTFTATTSTGGLLTLSHA